MVVLFNLLNLLLGIYFFGLATIVLLTHNIIKDEANKGKKGDYITDRDIHIMSGLFAYLTIYFFWNFSHLTWFRNALK